jgi:hypothetical protein
VSDAAGPALFAIRGDASAEEIAALTAVLGLVASSAGPPPTGPRREWGAPYRQVRPVLTPSPGGWKASALPR